MACAGGAAMMKAMYRNTPERLLREEEAVEAVSDGLSPAEIQKNVVEEEEEHMEWNDVTQELLRDNCPEVFQAICDEGARMERERLNEIDELTPAGYEEMAVQAKASGESAMAFYKRVIKAQKEKAQTYLEARRVETEPAKEIRGDSAGDELTEADAMKAFAKEMAAYAGNGNDKGMY